MQHDAHLEKPNREVLPVRTPGVCLLHGQRGNDRGETTIALTTIAYVHTRMCVGMRPYWQNPPLLEYLA